MSSWEIDECSATHDLQGLSNLDVRQESWLTREKGVVRKANPLGLIDWEFATHMLMRSSGTYFLP